MSNIVQINDADMQVIEYEGQRVVTLAQVDAVHGRPDGTARRAFNDHKHRLVEGEDYFVRNAYEAREMGFTAPNGLVLMAEQGYVMLVKPFGEGTDAGHVWAELVVELLGREVEQEAA